MHLYDHRQCGHAVLESFVARLHAVAGYFLLEELQRAPPPPRGDGRRRLAASVVVKRPGVVKRSGGATEEISVFPCWVNYVQQGGYSSETIVAELQRFARSEEDARETRYHQAVMEKMAVTNRLEDADCTA